jgi:hypothetical protein
MTLFLAGGLDAPALTSVASITLTGSSLDKGSTCNGGLAFLPEVSRQSPITESEDSLQLFVATALFSNLSMVKFERQIHV